MNTRFLRAIVRKDLLTMLQNRGVWLPIVILPVILLVIMPLALILAPTAVNVNMPGSMMQQLDLFMRNMPDTLRQQVAGLTPQQTYVLLFTVYFFAPFFLIIPLMVSSVTAADSFAGEKERKTLEALLYTPASDTELFMGKVLTALAPALAVSWSSFILYGIVVNAAGAHIMGRLFFPTTMWLALILWVVPAAAALGLSVMVLVSTKVKSFQEANQIGGMVVLPILLLVFAQAGGLLYFSLPVALAVGAVLWVIDAVLIFFGIKTFARGELIARL